MHLLIPAAGVGRRMGGDRNKVLLTLLGKPVIAWTLLAAEAAIAIDWIGVIAQPQDWPDLERIMANLDLSKPVMFVPGGRHAKSLFTMGYRLCLMGPNGS